MAESENQAPDTRHQAPKPKALILTGFGINCEEEMAAAYQLAGGAPTIVHLNEVLHGRVSIHDFDVLNFPGGFSFGDDLGAGVVLANKLRYRQTGAAGRTLLTDIREFVAAGKFVLGICNGFQVLVKLGLLPNLGGDFQPEVTLTHNASGRYEDRWVRLRVNPASKTPFLWGLTFFEVPVRHGEGRLVVPDAATRERIIALGLNCLTYAGHDGEDTGTYPLNPNGADLNCAGLTDPTGQIFGLMPHPEAFLAGCNHPDWGRRKRHGELREEGDGLAIFRNIVGHLAASATGADTATSLVQESLPAYQLSPVGERLTTDKRSWHTKLKAFGQQMRANPTPAEDALWQALRNRQLANIKFRRQHSIGQFIVDFFSPDHKLIIEVDGAVHSNPGQAEYDAGRTHDLEALGYKIIRFTNSQVLNKLPSVLNEITTVI